MRPIAIAVALAVLVLGLWQCTGAFEAEDPSDATVSVFGPWLGADADKFTDSLAEFTERTGIEVRYTGSLDFATELRARSTGGIDLPDVAIVPQPGLIAELRERGQLVRFSAEAQAAIDENYSLSDDDLATGVGEYVLPYREVVKSLVWYRPSVFAERGWIVPRTLDELHELVDVISTFGDQMAPWCFGVFSGADTGWPATDWVEDLVLRRAGGDVYDEWVDGERGFDDPAVSAAFEEFSELVLGQERRAGDRTTLLEAGLGTIPGPLFADPPGCAMYKQASFATVWFPDGTQIGPNGDVDFFVLPGVDGDEPAPLLVSGDGAVQLTTRPEAAELIAYLASPSGGAVWAERGGYLSGRTSVDLDSYYQPNDAAIADVLVDDRLERTDASDQMLPATRDLYLDLVTSWMAGVITYDDLAGVLTTGVIAG